MMNRSQRTQVHTQTHTPRQHRARCAGNLVEVKKTGATRSTEKYNTARFRHSCAQQHKAQRKSRGSPTKRKRLRVRPIHTRDSRLWSSRALASAAVCLLSRFAYSDFSAAGSGGKLVIMSDAPGSHRAVQRGAARRSPLCTCRRAVRRTHAPRTSAR